MISHVLELPHQLVMPPLHEMRQAAPLMARHLALCKSDPRGLHELRHAKNSRYVLRSAVGMAHVLWSGLLMGYRPLHDSKNN